MKHIKFLDSLRGFAVMLVILYHWNSTTIHLRFGWIGVNIFFVLSGFLITSILLEDKHLNFSKYLSFFYLKRLLRIFPLYYAYIIVVGLIIIFFGSHELQDFLRRNFILLFTYTFNFVSLKEALNGYPLWITRFYGHLWSLSIEEQYYIFFPLMVYWLSKLDLKRALIIIILITPLVRYGTYLLLTYWEINNESIGAILYNLPFSQCDGLAMGSLIALIDYKKIKLPILAGILLLVILIGAFNTASLINSNDNYSLSNFSFELPVEYLAYKTNNFFTEYRFVYNISLINLLSAVILIWVVQRNTFKGSKYLTPLNYLGKISYGVYVFHLPLLLVYQKLFEGVFQVEFNSLNIATEVFLFAIYFAIVMVTSSLSYTYFESIFIRLKSRISR